MKKIIKLMHHLNCILLIFIGITSLFAKSDKSYFEWTQLPVSPPVSNQTEAIGMDGAYIGLHNGALIVAGGTNDDISCPNPNKVFYQNIWVLVKKGEYFQWKLGGKLNFPIAYGAFVSTPQGVLCMGGNDAERTFHDVFNLQWDPNTEIISIELLPSLPKPCTHSSASLLGDKVYLAGGMETNELSSAMNNFWTLDLSSKGQKNFRWQSLPPWPGPARTLNMTVSQHNGKTDCIYVLHGQNIENEKLHILKDIYAFNPLIYDNTGDESAWCNGQDAPVSIKMGEAMAIGQSHVFIFGSSDNSQFDSMQELKDIHIGHSNGLLAYNTITDTWIEAGSMPQNQMMIQPIKWNDDYIVISEEIESTTSSPRIWKVTPLKTIKSFGWIDYATIIVYLIVLIGMGVFFSFRNKSTEDFFRGGQRIPWWASGCSIFATMLSSLTFMSIPAKAYATDWIYFLINMSIVMLAPFVIHYILPFFRKIDSTSAYEYLEKRFNLLARLIASMSYILFQIGRMAIVMFLPALALSTVTPISVELCVLLMGLMSIIYCTLGGVEAVIWTDTLQTIVLLAGAIVSFILIILNLDGGLTTFFSTAIADGKFKMINWDWSTMSYMTTALWVIVLGGLAQQLVSYTSDQGVVQRYMSVKSEQDARSAIWTNAGLSFLGSILFFALGTGLYVFYKNFPHQLDPTLQNDSVFPQFIVMQLPVGLAGLVIAGVFAAAQSTVSTSMNSIATAFSTDFVRRFSLLKTENGYFMLARIVTLIVGILGTSIALMFAAADINSMWDSFLRIIGLFGGPMAGLFILGIFSKRAHGFGAVLGVLCSVLLIALVQEYTNISFLLFAMIGISACVLMGWLFSLFLPASDKNIDGLTWGD